MADRPPEVCAFCGEGEEAGELRNTTDEDILAHYLCLLYSPLVISIPLKDSQDANNDFDIDSVKKEIRRGRKTICSHCGKKGGTIGCNVGKCNKTYHYLCVKRARGVHIHDEAKEMYIIYCEKHADDSSRPKERTNSSKRSPSLSGTNGTRRKQKSTSKSPFSKKRAGVKKPTNKRTPKSSKKSQSVSGSHETPTQMTQKYTTESPSPKRRRLDNIFDHVKKNSEDDMAVPSTSGTCHRNGTVSDSERESELSDRSPVDPEYDNDTSAGELKKTVHVSSTESPSSCDSESLLTPTPKITRTISLSGYPKKYKKRTKKRNNPELDAALTTMTSDERNAHSLLYDATGGSLMSQDWSAPQNYNNQTDSEGYATDVPASTVIITPETELANSAPSISKPGSPSAKESGTTSGQPDAVIKEISQNYFQHITKTDKPQHMALELEDPSNGSSSDTWVSSQSENTFDGIDGSCSPTQPVDESTCTQRFVIQPVESMNSAVSVDVHKTVAVNSQHIVAAQPVDLHHANRTMADALFKIFENFIKENQNIIIDRNANDNTFSKLRGIVKPSYEDRLNNSDLKNPELSASPTGLHTVKRRPVARTLDFSNQVPNENKSLDEQPSNSSKLLIEQPRNTECMSKQLNEHLKSPLTSKISDEQSMDLTSTNNPNDVSEEQRTLLHKSEGPSSFSSTGTSSLRGNPSHDPTFAKNGFSSPRCTNPIGSLQTVKRCSDAQTTQVPNENKSLDEQPCSPSKLLNEQPRNTECMSKQLNEPMKSPLTSKTSDEQPMNLTSTYNPNDFSEEQKTLLHKYGEPFSRTVTNSLRGNPTHDPISRFTKNGFNSPRSVSATPGKNTLFRPHLSLITESPSKTSVSPDARSDKTPLHVKDTSHSSYLSPQQLRQILANFKNGTYTKTFSSMVPQIQIQSTIESAKKTQPIIEDGNLRSEGSKEPNKSLQQTEQHSSDSDALQSHSDNASYEGPSVSAQQTTTPLNNFDANQSITGIGSRTSQTEISAGFPSKMELCLNNEQKSLLWKSYRLIQKKMKMSVMEPGTAQAFWSLCLENKCREFLLTMIQKDTKSVVHKIIHEDPEDKDYELAFALLQASGCFEDFIKAGDSDTSSTSAITEREPIDENESSLTSGPSIHNGPAEFEGQETSSNTSQTMMELEFSQTSPGGEGTIGVEDNSRIGACSPAIFSVSRRANEECPQSAPSEGRPQSAPSEGRPQSAPSEERPQSAPSEERPQSAPSGRRPQSAPSEGRPQSAPSEERPQSPPSEGRPQSPPSEGRPQSAPSEKRPQSGPSEERPQSPPSAENHSEIQLTLQKILQDLNTQRLQEQEVDGDAAFARSLVPFLRRVPEDQKLLTRIALQKIISSALSQNPQ